MRLVCSRHEICGDGEEGLEEMCDPAGSSQYSAALISLSGSLSFVVCWSMLSVSVFLPEWLWRPSRVQGQGAKAPGHSFWGSSALNVFS